MQTPFIEKTIGLFLRDMAAKFPDNECLIQPEYGLRLSYSEFDRKVQSIAKGLLKLGIKKGDHIAMWATNRPEWILTQFATARIGAVLVTVNTNYKVFELEYLLRQSDATTLMFIGGFKNADYKETVREIIPDIDNAEKGAISLKSLPKLKNLVYLEKDESFPASFSFEEIISLGKDISDAEISDIENSLSPDDVVNIQYTSGTTGFPKGVMLTHRNILNDGRSIGDCMEFTEKDKLLIHVPLFHCFGCVLGVMASITHATAMVILSSFSPIRSLKTLEAEKCTAVHGVPSMFIFMLSHPEFKSFDLSSLRTGIMAGSPCPIKVMEQVVRDMNMREITIAYGLTEASPVMTQTTVSDSLEKRVSTVGKPLPGIEVVIMDPDTMQILPNGKTGEICCRGYNIMKGYYNMPDATSEAIDKNGYLHSGDLGVFDEDGYLKITGRIKDMIIRGGENVYPREIEELLYTCDAVSDVQVVGVPSKELGEEIVAYIIKKENADIDEDGIRDFVAANMARHKVPKHVIFVSEFPMNAAGKIQKYKLREMAVQKYHLEEDAGIETA